MFDRVTITYRGAKYEIGRGSGFYGVWTAGGARSQPLERWPETPEGWTAAWSRFASIEAPGTIVPVGRNTPPVAPAAPREGEDTGPFGESTAPTGETGGTVVTPAGAVPYTPYGQYTPRVAPVLGGKAARMVAASLLGAGVILGVAGLFPAYIGTAGWPSRPSRSPRTPSTWPSGPRAPCSSCSAARACGSARCSAWG